MLAPCCLLKLSITESKISSPTGNHRLNVYLRDNNSHKSNHIRVLKTVSAHRTLDGDLQEAGYRETRSSIHSTGDLESLVSIDNSRGSHTVGAHQSNLSESR